jgi:hypothetical protein
MLDEIQLYLSLFIEFGFTIEQVMARCDFARVSTSPGDANLFIDLFNEVIVENRFHSVDAFTFAHGFRREKTRRLVIGMRVRLHRAAHDLVSEKLMYKHNTGSMPDSTVLVDKLLNVLLYEEGAPADIVNLCGDVPVSWQEKEDRLKDFDKVLNSIIKDLKLKDAPIINLEETKHE